MKRFSGIVTTAFALSLVTSAAFAGSIGTGTPPEGGPFPAYAFDRTIAAESLGAPYNVDLQTGVTANTGVTPAAIGYFPGIGLNSGDFITIEFTNALYMDADAVLLANIGGATAQVATNFGLLDPTKGVRSITMRVNNGVILPKEILLTLSNGSGNPKFQLDANIPAGGTVTMKVTAKTATGIEIPAAAASNTLFDVANQFDFKVGNPATSTIDVEANPSRTAFVSEGKIPAADTELQASAALNVEIISAGGGVEDLIPLDKVTQLALTLTPSTGVFESGEDFTNNNVYFNTLDSVLKVLFANNTTNATAVIKGSDLKAAGMGYLYIGTTEDVIKTTKNFTITANLTFTSAMYVPRTFGPTVSHTWGINGAQFIIPYFNTRTNIKSVEFTVTNTSSYDAEIYADVTTNDPTKSATNVLIGTAKANSVTTFGGFAIMKTLSTIPELAGITGPVSMKFIAIAPNQSISVVSFMRNSTTGETSSVPVLTDEEHMFKQ